MKTININYSELNKSLDQLEKDYPSRMHGNIDLLRANIRDNLFKFLSGDNFIVNIDEERKSITIGGKDLEGFVYAIYNHKKKPTTSEKMYEQIIEAEEQARRLGFYEKVFNESDDNNN